MCIRDRDIDMKEMLYKERLQEIQDDMLPVGYLGDKTEEHKYTKDEDGTIWFEEDTNLINW